MTEYIAHFTFPGTGVGFEIKMTHESKHYPYGTLLDACEALAKRLGAEFQYCEEPT